MSNLNTLSEIQSQTETSRLLGEEALARVTIVANEAISILAGNPDAESALKNTFHSMIVGNLRNPENIGKIIDGLYEARDVRLKELSPMGRLPALQKFSEFMRGFTENIAHMHRDITWSNESNAITNASNEKIKGVQNTYAQIITGNHPTKTA